MKREQKDGRGRHAGQFVRRERTNPEDVLRGALYRQGNPPRLVLLEQFPEIMRKKEARAGSTG